MNDPIDLILTVDETGAPRGVVSVNALATQGTLMMYEYARAAEDPAELQRITQEWAGRITDADELAYVQSLALRWLASDVIAPMLAALDVAVPSYDFRGKLAQFSEEAHAKAVGGGR